MRQVFFVMARLLALLMCTALPVASAIADLNSADVRAIHGVIQSQIQALAQDDAVGAFDLASPDAKERLGTPENFLQIIKEHYSPIYRHRLALFSPPENINGNIIQIVRLTTRDSHVWLAVYRMQRDTEGRWRVDGCQLFETGSVSV